MSQLLQASHISASHPGLALPSGRPASFPTRHRAAHTLGTLLRPLRAIKPLDWLVSWAFRVWYQMPVAPTHYYSPLPDVGELKANLHRWYRQKDLAGVRMNFRQQSILLNELIPFRAECDQLPRIDQVNAAGYGLGYGEVEAHLLHCMIRHLRPHTIVEVGSGVSTFFALNALEKNRQVDGAAGEMVCVEPYPRPALRQLAAQNQVVMHRRKVQDIEPSLFEQLEAGDILFIDSSHVSKVNSDVNFLFLDALPRLKKGVIVHVHDIPFPFMTCPPGHPMFEKSLLWNEAALLRAFLMWNGVFDILMCQSYLHLMSPPSLQRVVRVYNPEKHFPSSLWLQKVA